MAYKHSIKLEHDAFLILLQTEMAANKTAEGSKAHEKKRVIVIGAGLSGISAARHLQQHGGFDVVLLEGRQDRYGGRIWSESEVFTDDAGMSI